MKKHYYTPTLYSVTLVANDILNISNGDGTQQDFSWEAELQ